MTLATLTGCWFGGYEFPAEPGMLPDAGAQEQSYLWAVVMIVLLGVMYVRVRSRVLARVRSRGTGTLETAV